MAYKDLALQLENPLKLDRLLNAYLQAEFPKEVLTPVLADLESFASRILNEIEPLSLLAEKYIPTHKKYSAWGEEVDDIETHPAWKKLDSISAEEGLIAIGYERKYGKYSRPYQFAKNYLFHPSSAYYSCPLAMTDGAAKLIEVHGEEWLKNTALRHLSSRDPKKFWTSGQWMTEQQGGSDVGQTETTAELVSGQWYISGKKWFTSATSSQMTMLLARTEKDKDGKYIKGSRGLSLFFAQIRDDEGKKAPEIEVLRLKDKLGTKALPTAELNLHKLPAYMVGEAGQGVKTMSTLFNVSRINNVCASISTSARVLQYAYQYAQKREAFGKKLIDHPLHMETLEQLIVDFYKCFALGFFASELLGQSESEPSVMTEKLLRLVTPVAKLYTAKKNIHIVSECLESLGGAGYMEDVGIAKYYRDAQVLSIWEGTTNVLSLDVLRALHKEEALPALEEWLEKNPSGDQQLEDFKDSLLDDIRAYLKKDLAEQEMHARSLAFSLAELISKFWLSRLSRKWEARDLDPIIVRCLFL